jgi:hypothetical protein
MAKKSGERRLLFDTRGKRRHVIRVVYAILALLMGASLFLVIGPVNIGELVGNSSGGGSTAAEVLDEQVERVERRVAKDPRNAQLLLTLTRTQINAGNAKTEPAAAGEVPTISPEAHQDFEGAAESWSRYLKQVGDEPSPTAAQLVGGTFFRLAESGSTSLAEIKSNVALAVKAQRIAAEQQPSLGSLSTLAIYKFFNGEFAAGDKAEKEAAAKAGSKEEAQAIEKQLAEYRKRAKQYLTGLQKALKAERKSSKESFQNPFGGLGGSPSGSLGE